jgi:hypothetical protein
MKQVKGEKSPTNAKIAVELAEELSETVVGTLLPTFQATDKSMSK